MNSTSKKPTGFTLIEILVVVFIISILIGLLVPAINSARESARATQCMNNQHEIGVALISYETTRGRLPGVLSYPDPTQPYQINWIMSIFGDLGRTDLAQQWQIPGGDYTPVKVSQLLCPSDFLAEPVGGLSYFVNLGAANPNNATDYSGRLFRNKTLTTPEPDQTLGSVRSNARTVMFSERMSDGMSKPLWTNALNVADLSFQWPFNDPNNPFTIPANLPPRLSDPSTMTVISPNLSSNHRGMIVVTFCDGRSEKIPLSTYTYLDPENPIFGIP